MFDLSTTGVDDMLQAFEYETERTFVLLFDQPKEKYAYLSGCKLGFQKVPVGRINRVANQ